MAEMWFIQRHETMLVLGDCLGKDTGVKLWLWFAYSLLSYLTEGSRSGARCAGRAECVGWSQVWKSSEETKARTKEHEQSCVWKAQ